MSKSLLENFSELISDHFDAILFENGFKKTSLELEKYLCTHIYQKEEQFLIIHASNHPLDHPSFYQIILGEGNINFPERDWNSILLGHLKKAKEKDSESFVYLFADIKNLEHSVKEAKKDLQNFGKNFLAGNLDKFYKVRKSINKNREPYKVLKKSDKGDYKVEDEPWSVKLKNIFSK